MYAFSSIRDFGLAVDAAIPYARSRKSSVFGTDEFSGGLTFVEAVEIAKAGGLWPEGARDLLAVNLDSVDVHNMLVIPLLESGVCGFVPLIPAYLANQPDCMITMGESEQPAKVLRIVVDCAFNCDIEAAQIFNRGRAILAAVIELEKRGFSVELVARSHSNFLPKSKRQPALDFRLTVTIKRAGDALSPSSLAFVLCSAAFFRRCVFRLKESDRLYYPATTAKNNYGRTIFGERAPQGFDFAIHGITKANQDDYSTPARAIAAISAQINKNLTQA